MSQDEIKRDLQTMQPSTPVDYEQTVTPETLLDNCRSDMASTEIDKAFHYELDSDIEKVLNALPEDVKAKVEEVIRELAAQAKADYLGDES